MKGTSIVSTLAMVVAAVGGVAAPAAAYTPAYTFAGVADWDRDGHQDIVARGTNGDLWLYPGQSKRGYSSANRVRIGNGWQAFTFAGVADWDRDGHQDIIARNNNDGNLWLYPGQSKRGYSSATPVKIGNGWGPFTFADVADWDRDGHQDIVARNANRNVLLYPGQSKRGYSSASPVQIGNGWGPFTFAGVTDWDKDRHQDIVARGGNGDLWLYPGQSKRGYSSATPVRIGNGWGPFTFADVADWDRDGHQDVVARDANGYLLLYPGQSKRGYSAALPVRIGNGW
ncbi:FG-GAP repeat domain-containing protein [Actinoplanes sp. NPDC051494]|uniref:FG-GAP repeat domain-containing protein n=1 Tax=Actinoplanes sp. NPDC051494 TaxID=3363907 RepID=UPI003792327C